MEFFSRRSHMRSIVLAAAVLFSSQISFAEMRFLQINAQTKEARSAVASLGVSIEAVYSDSVWAFANEKKIAALDSHGYKILGNFPASVARGGHETGFDFPVADARFHNYERFVKDITDLQARNKDIVAISSVGKSVEGRDIWAIHINSSKADLASGSSAKPGMIYMGNHHAREHLSVEVPLMFAQYLMSHRRDETISKIIEAHDIWFVPMVNPDGVEFDVASGEYQMWRKNRRDNKDGTFGVDLNRNYGFQWGTGGSDTDTSSEVYMGLTPFSEPESMAMKNFVEAHLNAKVLVSFHSYSELILYPWGHKYSPIDNTKDHQVFETMAKTMATWNHYKPEQASSLYIASGDTTDWAYGAHGIFAFTFELSPNNMFDGGFYPGAAAIDKVFADNLKPCMYMLEKSSDPYQVLESTPTGMLLNYVEPKVEE